MSMEERDFKKHLKTDEIKRAYLLYGDEPYLTMFYTNKLITKVCGKDPDEFSFQQFDGQKSELSEIASAVETLPFGSDSKCVCVREVDASKMDEKLLGYWTEVISDLPETGVLIVRLTSVKVDGRNAKWKKFINLFDQYGISVQFPQQTREDCTRLLVAGAKKRGCELPSEYASLLVERCGSNLYRLINELDKICAVAQNGRISKEIVCGITAETLEARVFDLSKMILQKNSARAFAILQALKNDKEKPVAILSVLSNAYADLYRVKVAKEYGVQPETLGTIFNYKRREFVLQNASRDVSRMSLEMLDNCIDILSKADISMKSSPIDAWLTLDKVVTSLISVQ